MKSLLGFVIAVLIMIVAGMIPAANVQAAGDITITVVNTNDDAGKTAFKPGDVVKFNVSLNFHGHFYYMLNDSTPVITMNTGGEARVVRWFIGAAQDEHYRFECEYTIPEDYQDVQILDITGISGSLYDPNDADVTPSLDMTQFTEGTMADFHWIADGKAPTVTADPSSDTNFATTRDIILTAIDAGRVVTDPQNYFTLYHVWSMDETAPSAELINGGGAFPGQPVPKPGGDPGLYYLHVKALDDLGNESVTTFGPYGFNNSPPTVEFTYDSVAWHDGIYVDVFEDYESAYSITSRPKWYYLDPLNYDQEGWQSNQPIEVTVSASAEGGTIEKLEYRWHDSDPYTLMIGNQVTTPDAGSHIYELTVRATDNLGNVANVQSEPIIIDQSAPQIKFEDVPEPGNLYRYAIFGFKVQSDVEQSGGRLLEFINEFYQWTTSPVPPEAESVNWIPTDKINAVFVHDHFPKPETFVNTSSVEEDGLWYLYVKTEDDLGNVQIFNTEPVWLDRTLPQISMTPNGSGSGTGERPESIETKVTVIEENWPGGIEDYTQLFCGYDWTTGGEVYGLYSCTVAADGTISIPLTADNDYGLYRIHIRMSDAANNGVEFISDYFDFSAEPPVGEVQFEQDYTNLSTVEAVLSLSEHAGNNINVRYKVGSSAWSEWLPYEQNKRLSVSLGEEDSLLELPYTLTVQFQDQDFDLTSAEVTDTIIYDKTPPKAHNVEQSPSGWTNGSVTASVYYTDDYTSGSVERVFSNNGNYTVEFSDLAGNTNEIAVTIENIDKVRPEVQFSVNGSGVKQQSAITTVTAYDELSGLSRLSAAWSTDTNHPPADWREIQSGESLTLSGKNGVWVLWVKAMDQAGNETITHSGSFLLDNTPPTASIIYNPETWTAMPVTARLNLAESATVVNNGGLQEYTFADNGDFTFHLLDEAGNTGTVTASVYWIDKNLPAAEVSISPNTWTNGSVQVAVNTDVDRNQALDQIIAPADANLVHLVTREYGTIYTPMEAATVTEAVYEFTNNGTLYYSIKDLDTGLQSPTEFLIDNIDRVPPTGTLYYSETAWTRNHVTVTLQAEDDKSGATVDGASNYEFTDNGTHTFTIRDGAGNVNTISAAVDWIDREAPHPIVTYSTTDYTTQSVTASVYFDNESEPVTFINNGGSSTYIFDQNGTFTFEFEDAAGNTGTVEAMVDWIDKEAPTGTLKYSSTGWTSNDVTVYLEDIADNSGVAPEIISTGGNMHLFTENGQFTFKLQDAAGNIRELTAIVSRIDKTAPEATVRYSLESPTNASVRAYLDPTEPVSITDANDNPIGRIYDFTDNGTFIFRMTDRAGNTGSVTAAVYNIDRAAPVPEIAYSTTELTNGDVIATVTANEQFYVANNYNSKQYVFKQNGSFTFLVQDLAGNLAEITAEVNNIDKSKANIALVYSETNPTTNPVTVTVESDRPLTILNNGGSPEVTFTRNGMFWMKAADALGNEYLITIAVTNIDQESPVITFPQGDQLIIPIGGTLRPLDDVVAFDEADGDLTESVTAEQQVDASQIGEYEITYRVKDSSSNETVVVRKVQVVPVDELAVYVNGQVPTVDGEAVVYGTDVFLQLIGEQGETVVDWMPGRVFEGSFKTNHDPLENGKLSVNDQGYYTFLIQDQERQYRLIHVYVIPN